MQIKRSACKSNDAEGRFKQTLLKYATKHKKGDQWPKWFYDVDRNHPKHNNTDPLEQPHPTTKEYAADWAHEIAPLGPVGLLIEAMIWNGLAIDKDFQLWQTGEEPVDMLSMPYQNLKGQLHMMGARAKTRAEWSKSTSTRMASLSEIDRQASQVHPSFNDEDKGIIRTVQMGGTMGKQMVASSKQFVEEKCNYCHEAPSTGITSDGDANTSTLLGLRPTRT